jgi:hypothetical protein
MNKDLEAKIISQRSNEYLTELFYPFILSMKQKILNLLIHLFCPNFESIFILETKNSFLMLFSLYYLFDMEDFYPF